MENEHWPCTLTNDEVTLPVAALGSGLEICSWRFVDGELILDRVFLAKVSIGAGGGVCDGA